MSNVVSIYSKKPHISGDAHCIGCSHKWVAVAPVGATTLECPKCNSNKGIFVNLCCRFDDPHLTCSCGNDYLHVIPTGFYCPKCGSMVLP